MLELSIDNFDTTNVYWERNKRNYEMLKLNITQLNKQ